MSEMFKVQEGVPIPAIDRTPKVLRRKYPVDTMKVGGMFFVPERSSNSVSAYISRITKDMGKTFSTRHCTMRKDGNGDWEPVETDHPDAVEGTGVWRTK